MPKGSSVSKEMKKTQMLEYAAATEGVLGCAEDERWSLDELLRRLQQPLQLPVRGAWVGGCCVRRSVASGAGRPLAACG